MNSFKKGAMRRLAPNPSTVQSTQIKNWITGTDSQEREQSPRLTDDARIRALHKLSGVAKTRINPQTKKREFLLHRGMSSDELDMHNEQNIKSKTSWSPHIEVAASFLPSEDTAFEEGYKPHQLVSAWIPEEQIHSIPIAQGSHELTERARQIARSEHEVIVDSHNINFDKIRPIGDAGEWPDMIKSEKEIEPLEKKCPRCNGSSANSSKPSGRCSACLKKLKTAKKTPGHWQRAQTKADDALRRQDGKNGTAHHKSSGRGNRKSIVKQVQRAEKKTKQKLSPDRKNNGKGYAASNTRMVPEKLNRGRHKVDGKKLRAWHKRLKKAGIDGSLFETALLAKASNKDQRLYEAVKLVLLKKSLTQKFNDFYSELQKANKKQLAQMLGPQASEPHHQEAIGKIKSLFPNSNHDVWLMRAYREDPKHLHDNMETLKHISGQMQNFAEQNDHRIRLHDVSNMPFKEGLESLKGMTDKVAAEAAAKLSRHVYRPSSKTTEATKNPSGSSWFNINEPADGKLGALLGHCGNTGAPDKDDKLLYLATSHKDKDGKPYHKPSNVFILNNGFLGEMKGKHNLPPEKETHDDIVNMLLSPEVKGIIGGGYESHNNFNMSELTPEQREKVLSQKPNIDVLDTDDQLNPKDFPKKFGDDIKGHNSATSAIARVGANADSIIDAFKSGKINHDELAEIVSHPKHHKMFSEGDLSKLLDALLNYKSEQE